MSTVLLSPFTFHHPRIQVDRVALDHHCVPVFDLGAVPIDEELAGVDRHCVAVKQDRPGGGDNRQPHGVRIADLHAGGGLRKT